jgi:hypothetical protein
MALLKQPRSADFRNYRRRASCRTPSVEEYRIPFAHLAAYERISTRTVTPPLPNGLGAVQSLAERVSQQIHLYLLRLLSNLQAHLTSVPMSSTPSSNLTFLNAVLSNTMTTDGSQSTTAVHFPKSVDLGGDANLLVGPKGCQVRIRPLLCFASKSVLCFASKYFNAQCSSPPNSSKLVSRSKDRMRLRLQEAQTQIAQTEAVHLTS